MERINHYAFNLELEEDSLKKALNTSISSTSYSPPLTPSKSLKFYVKQESGEISEMKMKLPKQKFSSSLPPVTNISINERSLNNIDTSNSDEHSSQKSLIFFVKQESGLLEEQKINSLISSLSIHNNHKPVPHGEYYEHDHNYEDNTWPHYGNVEFINLTLRYRHDLPEVIKSINIKLKGGTKIGVVGRTGSGKSSLLLALSRLNEICGGKVLIDGRDTCEMPLSELREAISVIRK